MIKVIGRHYLYRHIRLDKNEPFYIGIGTIKNKQYRTIKSKYYRAYSKKDRNNYWCNIIKNTNYTIEILLESDDYEFIKSKEIEFIKLYGRKDLGTGTLVNLTDGGDGAINCIQSEESRYKKSINSSKSLLGLKGSLHPCSKNIYQYDLNGNFIKEYKSVIDACLENKCENIKNKTGKDINMIFYSNGFMWSYIFKGVKIYKYSKFDYKIFMKPVLMIDKDSDKLLNEFISVKQAAIYLGKLNKSMDISKCANGLRKTASGYKWRYK